MRKILINTPKGGVGKTTTATNIALLLARKKYRVLALDLAGGLLMSRALSDTPEFSGDTPNDIEQRETERVPKNFPGASNYDYAVIDTDDSYTVSEDLLSGHQSGWRVISPVNPEDRVGMKRIPGDIRAVTAGTYLSRSDLKINVVANMAYGGDGAQGVSNLKEVFATFGIESLVTRTSLPYSLENTAPILIDDSEYCNSLANLLREIGI